jgi:hypothetical protein
MNNNKKKIKAYCNYCGSTVGEISQRTESIIKTVFDCEKCGVNYCDQCSYEEEIDGQVKQICIRCDSEMEKL